MKVCALSPFSSSSKTEILHFIRDAMSGLLLLPGASASGNTPSPQQIQRILRPGMRVFVERKRGPKKSIPYLVTKKEIVKMPGQVFATDPSDAHMEELAMKWRQRTFPLGSRTVTFVLCGEINGFNPDGTVKHGSSLPYDIIANPVYTIMGRWNRLGKKLSQLSRGSKLVLHTANNDRNHHRVTTNVRIYRKGQKLAVARRSAGTLTWCECEI